MISLKSLLLKHTNKTTMNTQQTNTSNPFAHPGATYENDGNLEQTEIITRTIYLEDIIYRLGEITGRDNLNKLLSDQQKEAIINNIGCELEDYLDNYLENWLGQCDLEENVNDCFIADDCKPTIPSYNEIIDLVIKKMEWTSGVKDRLSDRQKEEITNGITEYYKDNIDTSKFVDYVCEFICSGQYRLRLY